MYRKEEDIFYRLFSRQEIFGVALTRNKVTISLYKLKPDSAHTQKLSKIKQPKEKMFSASMKRMIRLSAAAVLTFLVFDHLPTPACSHAVGVSSPRNSQSGHMALSDAQREHIQGRRSTEFTGRSLRDHVSRAAASSTNPFLRVRRDVPGRSCSTPADLPVQVRELNAFLNNSDYIALMPQQDDSSLLPTGHQHSSCPAATGSWWPGQEVNLRSTCPWVWENLDNGQDAYPR